MAPNVDETMPLLKYYQEKPPKEKQILSPKKYSCFEEELIKLEERAKKRKEKENSGIIFRARQLIQGNEQKNTTPETSSKPVEGEVTSSSTSREVKKLQPIELRHNPLYNDF